MCLFLRCACKWKFFVWLTLIWKMWRTLKVSQTTTRLNHKVYRMTTGLNEDSKRLICDCFRIVPRHQTKLTSRGVPGAGCTVRLATCRVLTARGKCKAQNLCVKHIQIEHPWWGRSIRNWMYITGKHETKTRTVYMIYLMLLFLTKRDHKWHNLTI